MRLHFSKKVTTSSLLPLVFSLAFLFAFSSGMMVYDDAYALKSSGTPLTEIGSKKVCGDRLCSEITHKDHHHSDPHEQTTAESDTLQWDIVPISEKISMLIGSNGFTGGNIAVLSGGEGLLIIDDGLPSALDGIKTKLEQLKTCETCGNVKFLVNTHWHGDHVGGNYHFGEQGAVIVAHENLRKLLSSPQELEFFGVTYDAYPDEALPVVTFDDSVSLYFNDETVQITHLPNGHTNNDSIIYFAESNVLHLGDHFFNGMFPFVDLEHGGSVQGLTQNIGQVIDRFPEDATVIPGHGKLADMQTLQSYHNMLVETTAFIQEQINQGQDMQQIQDAGLPDRWQSWGNGRISPSTWIEFVYTDLTQNKQMYSAPVIHPEKMMTAAPLPEPAMGPQIDYSKGYLVEEIKDGLYWVTDGAYQAMFLTTGQGVIAVDAPPSIGQNYLNAIAEVSDEPVTHVIYSHTHIDHVGSMDIFPDDAIYIAHQKAAETLAKRGDPNRPVPTVTFEDRYSLEVGHQRLELQYHGNMHEPGNIFIYAPDQKVLMLVDVIFPGWTPFKDLAMAQDVPEFLAAHDQVLEYDFDTFIGGHLTRLGTAEDVKIQKQYFEDIQASAARANGEVSFMQIGQEVGFDNLWLVFQVYADTITQQCTDEVVPKWIDKLGGVDLFTYDHCWKISEAQRID